MNDSCSNKDECECKVDRRRPFVVLGVISIPLADRFAVEDGIRNRTTEIRRTTARGSLFCAARSFRRQINNVEQRDNICFHSRETYSGLNL
jgi:hypothetical protein